MLQLTGNFTQSVCDFPAYFGSVGDEFFAHGFVGYFGAANVNHNCDWHFGLYFVSTPIHGCDYTVRNVACFIIEQGDFVGKTVNHEVSAFWHIATICHS